MRGGLFFGAIAWLLALGFGGHTMLVYEYASGPAARAPAGWPAGSAIEREPGRPTLVLLAHPRCPCTRATLDELAHILARARGAARVHVLFVVPSGAPEGFERSDTWHEAAALPGVEVSADPDGREARLLGAATSGQALLYSSEGALLFEGGITRARGHAGQSAGRDAILAALRGGRFAGSTPVYGCPLFDTETCSGDETCAN